MGSAIKALVLGVMAWLSLTAAVPAQVVEPAVEPWQAVITSQIEAFRAKDAAGAFQYASAAFQTSFPSAEAFFVTIISTGYAPIMESQSHSFGEFRRLDDKVVVQEVRLVGKDQSLYAAVYQLGEEPSGWRVQGVQLLKQPGMGI